MNKKSKKMKHIRSQKGIALLFSLAILSLLLVMALGFATNAIFDQRTAYNSANVTSARLMAQAELNKVFTLLKYYDDGIFYSHDSNPATRTSDMLERLKTSEGGSYAFEWKSSYASFINWNYVKVNDGITDRIIGRTAFVLIPDEGIDPGSLVNKDIDECLIPFQEKRIGVNVDEINIQSIDSSITGSKAAVFNYDRPPYSPVANPGRYSYTWIDFSTMFSRFALAGQPLSVDMKNNFRQKWFVIDAMPDKEAFWIDLNGDNVINKNPNAMTKFELFHRFYMPYYTDVNGNGVYDAGDTNNWDGMNINTTILADSDGNGIPDITPDKWSEPVPPTTPVTGNCIPWLALYGYDKDGVFNDTDATLKGTFQTVTRLRRQIVANLKDYCSSGYAATSDQPNWLPPNTAPTFTGNKRTPYIDEIGVALESSALYTKKTVSTFEDTLNVTVALNGYLLVKLIDIYSPTPWAQPFTLKVKGTISYNVAVDGNNLAPVGPQPFEFDLPSTLPFNWNGGYGTYVYTFNAATLPASLISPDINVSTTPNPVTVVNGVSVYIDMATLYDASAGFKGYDYSLVNKPAALVGDLLNTNADKTAQSVYFSFQTEDPRQNLNSDDWYVSSIAPAVCPNAVMSGSGVGFWRVKWENPLGTGYTGIVNEKGSPAGGYADALILAGGNPALCEADKEISTDPAAGSPLPLSTAFIRQAPMFSTWELGFIHRGVKWQTINLKAYDKDKAAKKISVTDTVAKDYCPGGGLYHAGDANILDQIKMTSQAKSPKKINIKTHRDEVLRALLDKIKIGCIPDPDMATYMSLDSMSSTTGLAIDAANGKAPNLIGKIKENDINFFTRAGIAGVAEFSGFYGDEDPAPLKTTSRNTDATQEELIGKTINLCEVGGQIEYFTVVIIAQAIRDVGGVGGDIPINKRKNDGFLLPPIQSRLGRFDYVKDGLTYYYADEITGEQKIKVRGYRDASGNCKILSYEYVE